MKQNKINRAYKSLGKLYGMDLPVSKAYGIYKLIQAIDKPYHFTLEKEQKYLAEYKGDFTQNGLLTFPTPEDCAAFKSKADELGDMDIEIEIEPVTLSETDLNGQKLSAADIFNLEGFVVFE